MNIDSTVNNLLNKMHKTGSTEKGKFGELAVYTICEEIYQQQGGILYHSYEFITDPEQKGNIKKENGKLYVENLSGFTELDVLLVTKLRVFPIEVKSYKAKKITFTDDSISGCKVTNKSPIHQNEMHCRHLYSWLFKALPEGATDYIVPIVCLADECEVEDNRSQWQKEYIKLCVLNNFKQCIEAFNTPLDYQLNLESIDKALKEVLVSSSMYLPPRI